MRMDSMRVKSGGTNAGMSRRRPLDSASSRTAQSGTFIERVSMIRRAAVCVVSVIVSIAPVLVRAQVTGRAVLQAPDRRDETLRLVGALAGDTPLVRDLESLTDRI